MYNRGHWIIPENLEESRHAGFRGRQQPFMHYGECEGYHRGLRPGHVFKGVTRELGRAGKLPCESTRKMRGTGRSRALAFADLLSSVGESLHLIGRHKYREHARYQGRIAKSERT